MARAFHVILPIYIAFGFMAITELGKAHESLRYGTLMSTSEGTLCAFVGTHFFTTFGFSRNAGLNLPSRTLSHSAPYRKTLYFFTAAELRLVQASSRARCSRSSTVNRRGLLGEDDSSDTVEEEHRTRHHQPGTHEKDPLGVLIEHLEAATDTPKKQRGNG